MNANPVIWCLLGKKAGDNTQLRALASALGYGFVEKHIHAQPWELLAHLLLRVTLTGIDRQQSDPLQGPWPDLVLSAGRRNEPVARWIQRAARKSGKATSLVHVGRPWAPLTCYDLIISTPQYLLPQRDNIWMNRLPLHRPDDEGLAAQAQLLRARLAQGSGPRIAVLAGGDSGKYVFKAARGAELGTAACRLADELGGSLMVTDSPRTPRPAGDALQAQLRDGDFCYRWGDPGDNPYQGLLGLADAFIVTSESASMLAEAVARGKPVYMFDMEEQEFWWQQGYNFGHKPLSHRLAMALAPRRMRRDISGIHRALIASGQASWLGRTGLETTAEERSAALAEPENLNSAAQELSATAGAVRQLLASG